MTPSQEVHSELPAMPFSGPETWTALEVVGLVDEPLSLTVEDLRRFVQTETVQDFRCNDGWVAPGQAWEGPAVSSVLERAGVSKDARYVNFSSGDFVRTLKLEKAKAGNVLLALQLNGAPVPRDNGGPCRLLAGDRMGPAHVKWVQRIEVAEVAQQE